MESEATNKSQSEPLVWEAYLVIESESGAWVRLTSNAEETLLAGERLIPVVVREEEHEHAKEGT